MTVIDQIKDRIDVVEFISAYVPLRKAGRNYIGFCPFHSNTRTPAFTVFPDTQSYHCFGCKASGTVFDFLMQREGLEFREALEQLAQRAGVELKQRSAEDEQQDQLRTRLLEINAAAAVFFQHILVKSPRGEPARAYMARRSLSSKTVEAFQLGYAVDEWSALLSYLTDRKGFEPEEIVAAGLAIQREQGGFYDRFRNRLIFPIRNIKGEIIAFGGRALGDAQPKYINSPQTPLFDKSRVLYGLDLARDPIREGGAAVIVEGYVDVIVAHQHGFRNVVAPLGTALTGEHAGVLKKLAKRIYLALDGDPAGVRATLKGVETLRESAEPGPEPTPQGMLRWERDLETEIRVLALPDGRDPDEIIQSSPAQWRSLIEQAMPVMDFYIGALTADLDLHSARGKSEAVARLGPLVSQIANPIEQAHYIQQIARLVGVDEPIVRAAMPSGRTTTQRGAPQPARPAAPPLAAPTQEDYLLGWLLRYPSARTAVLEKLKRDTALYPLVAEVIEGTPLELFERIDNRAIWQAWCLQPSENLDAWVETLDDHLRDQARRVLALQVPDPQSYRYVNDTLECATILQLRLAKRWKDRITQQAAAAADDNERLAVIERQVQVAAYIGTISTPKRSSTYADLHTLRTV